MSQAPERDNGASQLLIDLQRRVHATYKSRIRQAARLKNRSIVWNVSQITTGTVLVSASLVTLVYPDEFGTESGVSIVVLSIMALVMSLVQISLSLEGRSLKAFESYTKLQSLLMDIRIINTADQAPTLYRIQHINDEYQSLIRGSEGHSEADYFTSDAYIEKQDDASIDKRVNEGRKGRNNSLANNRHGRRKWIIFFSRAVTYFPLIFAVISVLILIPILKQVLLVL